MNYKDLLGTTGNYWELCTGNYWEPLRTPGNQCAGVSWTKMPRREIIYLMFISDLENLLSDWENVLSAAIMH